uniref:Uncharacterized protein n=1 Tax=Avena sativa TaxID=4498 RepID=A0ACD5YZB1_AVESA
MLTVPTSAPTTQRPWRQGPYCRCRRPDLRPPSSFASSATRSGIPSTPSSLPPAWHVGVGCAAPAAAPRASAPAPMAVTTSSLASRPTAAAAALASRRSDPAIRGRVTSPAASKTAASASPPAAPAPLVGSSDKQGRLRAGDGAALLPDFGAAPGQSSSVVAVARHAGEDSFVKTGHVPCLLADGIRSDVPLEVDGQVGEWLSDDEEEEVDGGCEACIRARPVHLASSMSSPPSQAPVLGMPASASTVPASSVATRPSLWASTAEEDEDSDDEELAPRTPPATKLCIATIVDKVESNVVKFTCAAASADGDEQGWVQVGRGGRLGREPSSLLCKEGSQRSLAFKRWARGRCFRCLERGHQVSSCREPFRCIRCRRPGHRERFCRARFPADCSRSSDTRARSPDVRAPCQRSHSLSGLPRHPSPAWSWAEVVSHSSLHAAVPPRSSPRCCKEFKVNANLDSLFQSQVALMRLELIQLVDVRIEEATRPLPEEVATLKQLLSRDGVSLESTEAHYLAPLDSAKQKSSVVEEEHLFGCFSPRGSPYSLSQPDVSAASKDEDLSGLMAPVLQITPKPHDLCGESNVVLPVELGSSEALEVTTTPSPPQSPASAVGGGPLVHSSETLFARELCSLLASLEAASPGYGKDIDCVLAGKASEDLIKKVEKSLRKVSVRGRRRKEGVARKNLAND